MNQSILLIDDDIRLCELLRTFLTGQGFALTIANTAEGGLKSARRNEYHLIILDIMLPDGDGLEVCKTIRTTSAVPIIMLTARGANEDKIIGLELGADDYLTKPFHPRELVARMKSVLRRNTPAAWQDMRPIEFDDFYLNPSKQIVKIGDREVELTTVEFQLLKVLASNPGKVFTRERLLDLVKGREFDGIDRSIDVHISRVRNKIEQDPKKPRWIKTIWGTGYRFQA
jgi:DNA-binding response OmpR family regulator